MTGMWLAETIVEEREVGKGYPRMMDGLLRRVKTEEEGRSSIYHHRQEEHRRSGVCLLRRKLHFAGAARVQRDMCNVDVQSAFFKCAEFS
jgi:hypothetical protein